ncbi:hypothetical protein [Rhizobium ruizarguesonis]|uniref:hypothetical protein n=1 Tax=Rhizobium ruizarguesonis TaxID=2081791 RepID=UPI001FDF56EF|nr:hypothetical protein [Rhizobium ruizarguesonis]
MERSCRNRTGTGDSGDPGDRRAFQTDRDRTDDDLGTTGFLYVRVEVINWAVPISDERFENFSQLVEAGDGWPEFRFPNPLSNDFWNASILKRAVRGLDIIRCIRDGKEIEQIKKDFSEEDSFIFDTIQFSKTRRERLAKWQDKSQH